MTWTFLLGYLALQLAVGIYVSRRIQSEDDYFVGGRRLGMLAIAFSLFATWFGAETCLGSSGAIYAEGLSGARADPLGYGLCLLLLGLFLAVPLFRGGYMTLGDLYRQRFGPGVERLAVLVLVPSSLIWAAAQVRAFGQVVSATMDIDVTLAIYLSAAFVVGYTFFGGLLGDVATDVIQGSILAISLLVMLGVAIHGMGGAEEAWNRIPAERLSLFPEDEGIFAQLDRFSIPILGSLVAQELVARVVSSRSERVARRAALLSCILYLVVGSAPVLLGLLGPELLPGLVEPETLLPSLATSLLPPIWAAVFSCALISAILSTIDSILLAAAALVSHNLLVPALGITSPRKKLLLGRLTVVAAGAFALVVALHADGIYQLVETASAFGTAGVLVVTIAGLYLPRGSSGAAAAALLTGLASMPVGKYVLALPAPFLFSVACAALAYTLFSVPRRAEPQPAT